MNLDVAAAARELVSRSVTQQGLPEQLEDETALHRLAALIGRQPQGQAATLSPRAAARARTRADAKLMTTIAPSATEGSRREES